MPKHYNKVVSTEKFKVGDKVKTFYQGKIREGVVQKFAPKASLSKKQPWWWIQFEDELKGTYYGRKLCREQDMEKIS